jgi:hypothetical protein
MSLVLTSINAATSPDTGSAIIFDKPRRLSWQFFSTGSPSSYEVQIYGSQDGVNFNQLVDYSAPPDTMGSTDTLVVEAFAKLVALTGGVSPTVTVNLAGED